MNEIMENSNVVIEGISVNQVPQLVTDQFESLKILKSYIEVSNEKAQEARNSAQIAHDKSAGLFHKKEAIESLQDAMLNLSEATTANTEAQAFSFAYQKKVAEITKYLFGLGATNIALNRSVVRELELKLSDASQEELDDLVKQEIYSVVKQLKAQEDLYRRQEEITDIVRDNYDDIELLKEHEKGREKSITSEIIRNDNQDQLIKKQEIKQKELDKITKSNYNKNREQDKEIARQAAVDEELGKRIDESVTKDKSQDEEIARQAAVDEELGKRIDESVKKDKSQDEEIARQAAVDEELGKRIDESVKKDKSQDEEIARQAAKDDELAEKIERLEKANLEKDEQINELKLVCDNLSKEMSGYLSIVENDENGIRKLLEGKASIKAMIMSYIIGGIGLIIALMQFFI